MRKNVGGLDRLIRIVVGIAIIAAGVYYKSWWGVLGAGPLRTAAINWCPLYMPFGLSSRPDRRG